MNILGSYSGIGMETVDKLIEAEKAKGARFTNKQTKIQDQQAAWKDIGSRLDSLYTKIGALQKGENFSSQTVRSNIKDSPFLSVSSNKNAASGVYEMKVKQLATASRLTGEKITTAIDEPLGFEGEFSFKSVSIDDPDLVDPDFSIPELSGITIEKDDSLKDIVLKINETSKDSNVQASVVDGRLILTSTELGESTVRTQGEDGLPEKLGFSGGEEQFKKGQNSIVNIDGMEIERNTNQIEDAIEGLTINLTSIHRDDNSEVITVAHDTQKTVNVVKEFIDQYNSVINFIGRQTDVGDPTAENNTRGSLVGESSLIRLQSSLRSLLTRNLKSNPDDGFNLSELGIEVDRYGVATLDEAALREKVLEDPANVARAFYQPESAPIEGSEATGKSGKAKGGMTQQLKELVESYTSKSRGIIKNKQDSYDRTLKDIAKQIETFDARIERKRARYISEFTALDQAMMQAESQMDYLYSQMNMGRD